ncbi:MAG: hypothetical protein PHV59_11525, partial [Victivallales bacterium]|nr:hypothetical protein [Victivallales bacterium]
MRTLQFFLLILIFLFAGSSRICFAGESADGEKNSDQVEAKVAKHDMEVKALQKDTEEAQKDAAGAKKDSEQACKDADRARKDAEDAKLNAEKARMDAEAVKKELKKAQETLDKSKVINISLFAVTQVAPEGQSRKEDNLSVVKPADFKVESFADLLLRIKVWWHDILKWLTRQQLSILVLFFGVLLTFFLVAVLGRIIGKFILWRVSKYKYSEWGRQVCRSLSRPFSFLIFTIGVFLSSLRLVNGLNEDAFAIVVRTFLAVIAFAVTWGIFRLVEVLDHYLVRLSQSSDNNLDHLLASLISKTLRFTIVFVAVLFIGQAILGLRITALVAGAGIA